MPKGYPEGHTYNDAKRKSAKMYDNFMAVDDFAELNTNEISSAADGWIPDDLFTIFKKQEHSDNNSTPRKDIQMKTYKRPTPDKVKLTDRFWTPYTEGIRDVMIPYCFDKFEETGYIKNFLSVAAKDGEKHIGPPFSDGLVFETMTGAFDFMSARYDADMDARMDILIEKILGAQEDDGFICTWQTQDHPTEKWGENGGDIIISHDLYDQGALIEAAVAHYRATKKTKLLAAAVKCANNICSYIGEAPKHNIIPGHSLPEAAFIMLYRLFRDTRELDDFAKEHGVDLDEYLEIVRFWYDNRGTFDRGRKISTVENGKYTPEYNQDTKPFAQQRTATGHAVRAGLCYMGASMASLELDRHDYKISLDAIFSDVVRKKMHISGGIGARHDIEGFDKEYDLPNNAYLETCAGIALAFWAAEMDIIDRDAKYFDIFELSLYNNILGAVGKDFKTYYYDNALVNDGTKNRWNWHVCPCCPPMLSKIYSNLGSYVYSYAENELCVNMYIGAEYENGDFKASSDGKNITVTAKNDMLTLALRIPSYTTDFTFTVNGKAAEYTLKNGYAVIVLQKGDSRISVSYTEHIREIYANNKVEADKDRICIMKGITLMCTEGADNGGETEFTLAKEQTPKEDGENIILKSSDGKDITFIPYFRRNNRVSDNTSDSKMSVWLTKDGWNTDHITDDSLYGSIIL